MDWRLKFFILLCAFILTGGCSAEDLLYKTVHLGKHCSFSIPFLWKKKEVTLNLPAHVKSNIESYKSLKLIGKEVIVTASYANYKSSTSIDGGVAETVRQLSSLPNTTDFAYSCAPFKIKGGTAKVCRISYKSGKAYICAKALFVVPSSDLTSFYSFCGFYRKTYKWGEEVLDKLYR